MQSPRSSYGFYSVQSPSSREVYSGASIDDVTLLKYSHDDGAGEKGGGSPVMTSTPEVTSTPEDNGGNPGLGRLESWKEAGKIGINGDQQRDSVFTFDVDSLLSSDSWTGVGSNGGRSPTGKHRQQRDRAVAPAESWWKTDYRLPSDTDRTLTDRDDDTLHSGSNADYATEVYHVGTAQVEHRLPSSDGHREPIKVGHGGGRPSENGSMGIHLAVPCRVVAEDEGDAPFEPIPLSKYPNKHPTRHKWPVLGSPRGDQGDSRRKSDALSPSMLSDPDRDLAQRSTETASLSYLWSPPSEIGWQRPRRSTETASTGLGSFNSARGEGPPNGVRVSGSGVSRGSTPERHFRFIYGADGARDHGVITSSREGTRNPVARYAGRDGFQREWYNSVGSEHSHPNPVGISHPFDRRSTSTERTYTDDPSTNRMKVEGNRDRSGNTSQYVYDNRGYEYTSTDSTTKAPKRNVSARTNNALQAPEFYNFDSSQTSTLDSVFSERSWSSVRGRPLVFREKRRVFPKPRDPLGDVGDGLKMKRKSGTTSMKTNHPVEERMQKRGQGSRDVQPRRNPRMSNARQDSHRPRSDDLQKYLIKKELRMYMTREAAKREHGPTSLHHTESSPSYGHHHPYDRSLYDDPRHRVVENQSRHSDKIALNHLPPHTSGTLDRHYRRIMGAKHPQRPEEYATRQGDKHHRPPLYDTATRGNNHERRGPRHQNDVNKPLSSHGAVREDERKNKGGQLPGFDKESFPSSREPSHHEVPTISGDLGSRDRGHRREIRGRPGARRDNQGHFPERHSHHGRPVETKTKASHSRHETKGLSATGDQRLPARYTGPGQPPHALGEGRRGPRASNAAEKTPGHLPPMPTGKDPSPKSSQEGHPASNKDTLSRRTSTFSNWRFLSTMAAIWFCPIGIWALRKSKQVDDRVAAGNMAGAKRASRSARNHAIVAFVFLGIIVLILLARLIEVSLDPDKTFIQNFQPSAYGETT